MLVIGDGSTDGSGTVIVSPTDVFKLRETCAGIGGIGDFVDVVDGIECCLELICCTPLSVTEPLFDGTLKSGIVTILLLDESTL